MIYGLFFASGAAALTLEVAFTAHFGRIFGTTAEAAAATLAAFFLGLGVGAAFWGQRAGRLAKPLWTYGALEIGVAGFAFLPLASEALYGPVYQAFSTNPALLSVGRLGLAVLLVGPSAFCMGGTLPVLGQYWTRTPDELGRRATGLYAANTLGAALGCLAATFWLPAVLGWQATLTTGAAVALLVGLTALVLADKPTGTCQAQDLRFGRLRAAPSPPALSALAFCSGLGTLSLQLLWLRMFAQAHPGSIYVFGAVLVTFLVSLALGAGVAHVLARRRGVSSERALGGFLLIAGALVALTIPAYLLWTGGLRPPPPGQAFGAYVLRLVGGGALVLGLPVVALGVVFPWLMKVAEGSREGPGRIVGRLAAWNTAGAIVGSLLGGFVLLPVLGLWGSIRAIAILYAALGVGSRILWSQRGSRVATTLCFLAVIAAFLVPAPVVRLRPDETLLEVRESAAGSVAVIERDGERKLVFDNVFTLGGTHDARWEAMQTHVPLCLHPAPKQVFFLGLGTGLTAAAALEHPVERVVVAELVPDVIAAADTWFRPFTTALFAPDSAVDVRADDARHALRWSSEAYDVVVGDLFFPWEPGTTYLYTVEHFRAVRERLAPGGIFAQWLPCYQLTEAEFLGIARTMMEAFDEVLLWRGDFFADKPLLALVGYRDPARLDPAGLRAAAAALGGPGGVDLAEGADTIPLHLYAGNLTAARSLLARAEILTDDRPWLAFSAPRSERAHQAGSTGLFVGANLLAFETALREACPVDRDPFLAEVGPRDRAFVEAGLTLREMAVRLAAGDRKSHARALRRYILQVPAARRPDLDRWIE